MNKWMYKIEEYLLLSIFCVAFLSLVAQVISRNIFGISIVWSEELARILFLWIVFLGASYCLRVGGHISIDFFISRLPDYLHFFIVILINIISGIFMIILSYVGIDLAIKLSSLQTVALEISSFWLYAAVPVGCFFMAIRYFSQLISVLRNGLNVEKPSTLL